SSSTSRRCGAAVLRTCCRATRCMCASPRGPRGSSWLTSDRANRFRPQGDEDMDYSRRILLAFAFSAATLTSACAQNAPLDAAGRPLEPLSIVTQSGEHQFMVEIADDE